MISSAVHPHMPRRKHTLHVGLASVCTVVSGMLMFTGCAGVSEAADQATHRFNADSSLLGPGSSTTYVVTGNTEGAAPDSAVATTPDSVTLHERDDTTEPEADPHSTIPDSLPSPYGTLIVSNGMITSAEFVASVETAHDMRFILTEPALYERRGKVLDLIYAFGTLSTSTAMYPDTRITLTPEPSGQGTLVNATLDIPESLTAESVPDARTVRLALFMEPLATFDGGEPSDSETPESTDITRPQEASGSATDAPTEPSSED